MPEVDQIKSIISEQAKHSSQITGSVIGLKIRREFPELDMKRTYGGLRKFIEEYCANEVSWVRKNGGDDIYKHISRLSEATNIEPTSNSSTTEQSNPPDYWKAFSNPNTKEVVVLDINGGQLSLGTADSTLREFQISINKISRDEYKEMAWRFLPQVAEPLKNDFRQVLSLDDFWPHWSALMWKYKHQGIFDEWVKWRNREILSIFETRLRLAEISSDIVAKAIAHLRQRSKKVSPLTSTRTTSATRHLPVSQLRKLIHEAVEKMGDEELRRIWLPLGTLADALKNSEQ